MGKHNNTIWSSIIIVLLWIPILFFDSVYFSKYNLNGKVITSIAVISITIYLLYTVPLRLRTLMLIMIPLSWLGEFIFCVLLDMYDYRGKTIPIYVPFGHASIFAMGWLITQKSKAYKHPRKIKKWLGLFYIFAFTFVIIILKDTLSLLLGILFFMVLKRKKFLPFYFIMGLLVLYLELVGTYFGAWTWHAKQGVFQTVNPPLGVVFIYVGGDLVLGRFSRFLLKKRRKLKLIY